MKVLVTGGAGFIGSAVIRHLVHDLKFSVVNVDKLTYAGNLTTLESVAESPFYSFCQVDICDAQAIDAIFNVHQPEAVMHLAAESHVDRSIDGPADFINTNIIGTYILLEASKKYYSNLDSERQGSFKFHHISTDEVYGDLHGTEELFTEKTPYAPSSPYSASKASSDHLVRAWGRTFDLPVVISNCSNNYGPFQYPEKLIPTVIINALNRKPIPVYGEGLQIRDWLYVEDHARALVSVMLNGKISETYNIGGHNEKTNVAVVRTICSILQGLLPNEFDKADDVPLVSLIKHVSDRPGHDFRYAIDASKIENELGWVPVETFESGMRKTVVWYLENVDWWQDLHGSNTSLLDRLGLGNSK